MDNAMFGSGAPRTSRRGMLGVTLIELLIVCVVIGILTAVAYPSYRGYVLRTNRADGKGAIDENGGVNSSDASVKLLQKIDLYSKSDLRKNGLAKARPIQPFAGADRLSQDDIETREAEAV